MSNLALLLPGAAGACALGVVAVWRPAVACALLAAAIPVTAGLGRGTVIPLLRVNEALLLVVVGGWLLHNLPRRRSLAFNGLDLAVFAFCVGGAVIPWALLFLTRQAADLSEWMIIVGPVQYLIVFLLVSRTEFSSSELRLFLNLVMLASIPVALIALAELLNLGGVRQLFATLYPTEPLPSWDTVYRPTSLLGHFSAVGAFGLLNFLLALALAAARHPDYPRWWLAVVLGANLVGTVAANTYAPLVALPLGVVVVLVFARHIPWREFALAPVAMGACLWLLWPHIQQRLQVQTAFHAGGLPLPETLRTRLDYWQGFFVPALLKHGLWLGTGTLIPGEVPRPLVGFVDNGYLWQLFRAGLPGLASLFILLGAVVGAGWAARWSGEPTRRAVGATCLAGVACVLVLDTTSEYLTMTAVTQEFWMLVGLLSGLALAAAQAQRRPVLVVRPEMATIIPAWWTDATASVRRLAPRRLLLRSSVAVVIGLALARILGFLFQVVSGRLLFPAEFGRLVYALAVANVLSVLLTAAPLGLSRFLARHEAEPEERDAYYTTYLTIVFAVVVCSCALTMVVAGPLGLGGWMLLGLLANLLGITALETYGEVLRGLGRYTLQSVFYVLANALQLLVVVVAATFALHSPTLFVTIYGLSGLAALVVIAPASPLGLHLSWPLSWRRVRSVLSFVRPLLVQVVFWNVWFCGDLILVRHLMTASDTGSYGAAKAIANGFALIPTALGFVFAPRVARLAESEVRGHLVRVLGLATALTAPLTAAAVVFARPLTASVFGGEYAAAAVPLVVLSLGMALYGIKSVLSSVWLGVGYPIVMTVSSGAGMVVTMAAGLLLIPRLGLAGAAAAFSSGALAQLLVEGAVTVWAFGPRTPRVRHFSAAAARAEPALAAVQAAPRAASILLVAEELDLVQDEGYTKFARVLEAELGRRRGVVTYVTRHHRWEANAGLRLLQSTLELARCALSPELREAAPDVVLYASRCPLTLPALLRARLLKLLCRAPVALAALQGSGQGVLSRRLARGLVPDLLLVPTQREVRLARGRGLNAACVWSGVDVERFRPAKPGEKEALRLRYGLPDHHWIVLHVGHLRAGRNLTALLPLARQEGLSVVVVASGRRNAESKALKAELEQEGVVVLDGYQPHIEELYRLADCYVFPTLAPDHAVATPLSVLEALASGVPVVSTRFGALEDLLGSAPGLSFVDDGAELVRSALSVAHQSPDARALARTFSWQAIAERLLGLLDELVWAGSDETLERAGPLAVVAARARRFYTGHKGLARRLRHRRRPGYASRPASSIAVERMAAGRLPPEPAEPSTDLVGLVDMTPAERSALRAAAGFYGLPVEGTSARGLGRLGQRALLEGWPLLSGRLQTILDLSGDRWSELLTYLRRGGTLYLDGLEPLANGGLVELSRRLGLELPTVVMKPRAWHLLLPPDVPGFARELAGTRLEADCRGVGFQMGSGARALAFATHTDDLYPIVVDLRVGSGRLVLSVLPGTLAGRLAEAFGEGSTQAAPALVPMLLLRELYGSAAWQAPVRLANFTIDDPALRQGLLGMPYATLLSQARDQGFHLTAATVPRELRLAEPSVVWRLRLHPDLLSACYHGCDHEGYEFYLPRAARTRYPPRPLAEQRAALARAVQHGRRFQAQTGYALDRVMVFPLGVGPAELFGDLHRLGFIATSNYGDKYPLAAPIPDDADIGLRPADLAWEGFPLLWRRGFTDQGFLLDLFLQRPALTFAHLPWLQKRGFEPLLERAEAINRAGRGQVSWRGLDEVARHAYLQRRLPGGSWQLLLTGNEACLHNPDPVTRSYALLRPHLPAGSRIEVNGVRLSPYLGVTVPPQGTTVVRLVAEAADPGLARRAGCSIFSPPSLERRELA